MPLDPGTIVPYFRQFWGIDADTEVSRHETAISFSACLARTRIDRATPTYARESVRFLRSREIIRKQERGEGTRHFHRLRGLSSPSCEQYAEREGNQDAGKALSTDSAAVVYRKRGRFSRACTPIRQQT